MISGPLEPQRTIRYILIDSLRNHRHRQPPARCTSQLIVTSNEQPKTEPAGDAFQSTVDDEFLECSQYSLSFESQTKEDLS